MYCCILNLYAENVCEFIFQPLSTCRLFILSFLHYIFCNILPWHSVPNWYCRYQSFSPSPPQQNFRQLFFSFWKVWGYPTSLISRFINFNNFPHTLTEEIIKMVYFTISSKLKSHFLVIFQSRSFAKVSNTHFIIFSFRTPDSFPEEIFWS